MGYQTEKLSSGALLVKDVPLMSVQKLDEPHFKIKDINRKWMEKGLARFVENKAKGKLPYLWDRHNTKDVPAKVIGRLDKLRIDDLDGAPWYFADVIITSPEHQQKFLNGDYPSKSVEFQPDNHYLRGLALLDGQEGHFDASIPDFVPEGLYDELVALGADATCTVMCHSASPFAKDSTMTNEELLAAINAANKPLLDKLNAVETELATVKAAKKASGDVDADLAAIREEERASHLAREAKNKREAKITAYSAQLSAKTKTTINLARKKLDSFQTDEGMDTYFEAAMSRKEEDVKLGIEREHGDSPDLDEEYAEYKRNYPETTVSLRQYKHLSAGIGNFDKDYGANRQAVKVGVNGNSFVNA